MKSINNAERGRSSQHNMGSRMSAIYTPSLLLSMAGESDGAREGRHSRGCSGAIATNGRVSRLIFSVSAATTCIQLCCRWGQCLDSWRDSPACAQGMERQCAASQCSTGTSMNAVSSISRRRTLCRSSLMVLLFILRHAG